MSSVDESPDRLNLLVAYPYITDNVLHLIGKQTDRCRFVVDSGAFTAWKAGKPIALDDYCRFIEGLPVKPWRYFTLDVIGDPHASMRNYETMLSRGFTPVPIFTRGEDPSVLDDYYKTSEVVGIGGLVGTKGNRGFVNGIMRHVKGRKVHWLGFTNTDFIKHYRPYMCDSSTWEAGARFATVRLYMGGGRFVSVKKSDFATRPPPAVLERIKSWGLNPYALANLDAWHGGASLNRTLCAGSGVAMSMDVERNTGTKMFIAVATECGLRLLIDQYLKQTTKGTIP